MSMKRATTIAARSVLGASRRSISPRTQCLNSTRVPSIRLQPLRQSPLTATSVRFLSSDSSEPKVYDFDSVKSLSESPQKDRLLIDVREPTEYEAGYIPTAINIPVGSSPDALFMPAHEFEDKFGFAKPTADQELVFYCKAGVRSSAALKLAQQVGYQRVGEYRGSWMDWVKRGGGSERD